MKKYVKRLRQKLVARPFKWIKMLHRWQTFFWSYPNFGKFYLVRDFRSLLDKVRSDTVVIFGSGYSINSIKQKEFEQLQKFNTISFNFFVKQNFIKIDYHIVRELTDFPEDLTLLKETIDDFSGNLDKQYYEDSIFLLQRDILADGSLELLQRFIFKPLTQICFFKTFSRKPVLPSDSFDKGLVHNGGTLSDCINLAYLLGFKRIILAGVDLYDRRYFWLNENETHLEDLRKEATASSEHNTSIPIINLLKKWSPFLKSRGLELVVLNPKSLLSDFLPVYRPDV